MKPQDTPEIGIVHSFIDYTTNKNQSIVSGDEIVIENQEELDSNAVSDEESVYPMKTIKLDKGFYTIFELKRKFEKNPSQIILDSSFQRNNVWKINQERELIESVLMGLAKQSAYNVRFSR